MRLALIIAFTAGLAACGAQQGPAGPERRSAAGEVLGGEASDAMLPTDSLRSTSPTGSGASDGDEGERAGEPGDRSGADPAPRPTLKAAPVPDMTMPADPEPLPTPEG